MSTRGAFGFRVNNQDKLCISRSDSYPFGLGVDVFSFVASHTDDQISQHAKLVKVLGAGDYAALKYINPSLGDACFLDASKFIMQGTFCEWAYIVNVDTQMVEVYTGFNENTGRGRYNHIEQNGTKPGVALVAEVPWSCFRRGRSREQQNMFIHEVAKASEMQAAFINYGADNEDIKDQTNYFEQLKNQAKQDIFVEDLAAGVEFKIEATPLTLIKVKSEKLCAVTKEEFELVTLNPRTKVLCVIN